MMAEKKYPIAKSDMRKEARKSSPAEVEPKREIERCPQCKKDYAEGVKAAYKLGLLDGENRLKHTINLIHKTNRQLFNELLRLDNTQPLNDAAIKFSRKYTEVLIRCFKKHGDYYHVRKITKLIKSQLSQPEILGEIREK